MGDKSEQLSQLCKALSHPARVRILETLLARDACYAGELVDEFPLAQSTISQHLKIMKEAGLIIGEVDGPRRCYCVSARALNQLKKLVAGL